MLAFPLQLSLMTDPSFPFSALGLVHIANRIVQHRPVGTGDELALRVHATNLSDHPRGKQFTMRSETRVGDELVWEEDSTYLRRGGGASTGDDAERPRRGTDEADERLPVTATWRLPGDLGRRYGSVSGDMNPIHIHPLSARLFGFPTAIAHGMWTMARCLAALDPRLPQRFSTEVEFKKPILLPATVEFSEREDGAGIGFAVRGAGKGTPHLDGRVQFA
jgi:acyl dehydratase